MLVTFIAILIGLFVLWHFLPQRPEVRAQPKYRHDPAVDEGNPDWRDHVDRHCESPAERAFIAALIERYELMPRAGVLCSENLRIDFQVQEAPYRVDFLANEWLVVEIDGAAYHSSPEARARDHARDEFFRSLGYAVLRIPAKLVFNHPGEAIERFASALAVGRNVVRQPPQGHGFQRVGHSLAAVSSALEEINARTHETKEVNRILEPVRRAVSSERALIEAALANARGQTRIAAYVGQSLERQQSFDRFRLELETALNRLDKSSPQERSKTEVLVEILRPTSTGNLKLDASIGHHFDNLLSDRREFLDETRSALRYDRGLNQLFLAELEKAGAFALKRQFA